MKILSPDSKFMTFMNVLSDLAIINILTLICCLPVITAGASITAMHHMCYKVLKSEGTGLAKGFFSSFKINLRQATAVWVVKCLVFAFFIADVFLLKNAGEEYKSLIYVLCGLWFLAYVMSIMIFPMLSRFKGNLAETVRNGVIVSASIFPGAVIIGIMFIIPVIAGIFFPAIIPLAVLFGLSLPGYLAAMIYKKAFERLESNSHFDEAEAKSLGQIDE